MSGLNWSIMRSHHREYCSIPILKSAGYNRLYSVVARPTTQPYRNPVRWAKSYSIPSEPRIIHRRFVFIAQFSGLYLTLSLTIYGIYSDDSLFSYLAFTAIYSYPKTWSWTLTSLLKTNNMDRDPAGPIRVLILGIWVLSVCQNDRRLPSEPRWRR